MEMEPEINRRRHRLWLPDLVPGVRSRVVVSVSRGHVRRRPLLQRGSRFGGAYCSALFVSPKQHSEDCHLPNNFAEPIRQRGALNGLRNGVSRCERQHCESTQPGLRLLLDRVDWDGKHNSFRIIGAPSGLPHWRAHRTLDASFARSQHRV